MSENEEMIRRFGPMPADSPAVGNLCLACHRLFKPGDFTALVPLGPGDDEEARERCRRGRPYNSAGIEVHFACHTGIEDPSG